MSSQKVNFTNRNGQVLSGKVELPANGETKAFALFAHCFTCNKNLKGVRNISRALSNKGIGILRFDFTGLGDSQGEFADTSFSSNVEDLLDAAEFLKKNYSAPSLIIGHSLGGAAVIFASQKIESIKAVATIGAPSDPKHVEHLFSTNLDELENKGVAEVNIGGRSFNLKKEFIDDLREQHMEPLLNNSSLPILILHSPVDSIVGIENATEIYKAARHPKSFISLGDADHLLSKTADSVYTGNMIAGWAEKYLKFDEIEDDFDLKEQVAVRLEGDGFTTEVKSKTHGWVADEPVSVGGKDLGPNPYELMLSALGSCTAMTMKMYAARKKWPLEEVIIQLKHSRKHMADCEECEDSNRKMDVIEKTISIQGSLDDTQKARLMEIADKCPVHKTIQGDVRIISVHE